MICYRDRVFCVARCAVAECDRKVTPRLCAQAQDWWGGADAPVATADMSEKCERYVAPCSGASKGGGR